MSEDGGIAGIRYHDHEDDESELFPQSLGCTDAYDVISCPFITEVGNFVATGCAHIHDEAAMIPQSVVNS